MAKSRYNDTELIDNKRYATFSLPVYAKGLRDPNLLQGVQTFEYIVKLGDRLDHLSARFYGDDSYWWVIALVNGISYPLSSSSFGPGKKIKVARDARDIFVKIFR